VSDPRVSTVGQGYDEIADVYLAWTGRIAGDPKVMFVANLSQRLQDGARVLELGCGAGEPCTRLLAERFQVTGVDISSEQLVRARANVPSARFVQADLIYVLNHVPRESLADVFHRIAGWLVPGGLFLAPLGTGDTKAWTGQWLGTTMFFSSWDPPTNRALLRDAGFELLVDELVTIHEPEPDGPAQFQWVLAQR
jgi:SAM-dependent methyltransferase